MDGVMTSGRISAPSGFGWRDGRAPCDESINVRVPRYNTIRSKIDAVTKRTNTMQEATSIPSPVAREVESFASPYGFAETLARLQSTLQAKGIDVFASIDH